VVALHHQGGGFDARLLPRFVVDDLKLVAVALHPVGIHAQEHLRPVLAVHTAGAAMYLQDGVAVVVGVGEVGGEESMIQRVVERPCLGQLFLRQFLVLGFGEEFLGGFQIAHLFAQRVQEFQAALQLLLPLEDGFELWGGIERRVVYLVVDACQLCCDAFRIKGTPLGGRVSRAVRLVQVLSTFNQLYLN
jgi:hypothetical protein